MKLTPEARGAVNEIMAEAHADGRPTREIASKVVSALRDMEPAGLPWVDTYIDELAILGAQKMCADWRRRQARQERTKRGTSVPVPVYVGQNDAEGAAVQMPFDGLDLDGLRRHRSRLASQRNTLSIEIQYLADLIEVMEGDESIATAGDAAMALRERVA